MEEGKTTNQPGPPPTTSIGESPVCLCCTPAQPLEPPAAGENLWVCPVEQTKYEYNPADGTVRRVGGGISSGPVSGGGQPSPEMPTQKTTTSLFPEAPPARKTRQVNPDDPFAR
ncbi:MAG: hypothetical protein Q8R29_02070 [bacterium]|nr:hypothetical protein [bacterium]